MSVEINLLPTARRIANDRRSAVRRWILWGSLWCAVLAAAQAVAVRSRSDAEVVQVERELDRLLAERDRLDEELVGVDSAIDRSERSLAAARAIVDHPDWSALLSRVVSVRSQGMTFRRWVLARAKNGALGLRIEGGVPMLGGLTDFALRLEDLKVFRRVSIVTAQANGPAATEGSPRTVSFAIDAELIGPAPVAAADAPEHPNGGGS